MCRTVIPRFLPAVSGSILGEFWPHAQNSADWVQRPQTDTNTQGEVSQITSRRSLVAHNLLQLPVSPTVFPLFSRVQMGWSTCWLPWMRARWWISWRTKMAIENWGEKPLTYLSVFIDWHCVNWNGHSTCLLQCSTTVTFTSCLLIFACFHIVSVIKVKSWCCCVASLIYLFTEIDLDLAKHTFLLFIGR